MRNAMPQFQALICIPRLRVINANAVSSPLTYGCPSITAFAGAVHAAQRALNKKRRKETPSLPPVTFCTTGVVMHEHEVLSYRPGGRGHNVFRLTRNPLDETGSVAAIVEEGRMHMTVSLLIGVIANDLDDASVKALAVETHGVFCAMRLAGGSVVPAVEHSDDAKFQPTGMVWSDREVRTKQWRRLRAMLLPGFALVARPTLLSSHLRKQQADHPEATALDALLDLCAVHFEPKKRLELTALNAEKDSRAGREKSDSSAVSPDRRDSAPPSKWAAIKRESGWLVPIPIGYSAISPLYAAGTATGVRDRNVPFRFVESVLSLGQWVGPHRLRDAFDLLWYHDCDAEQGTYLLRNHNQLEAELA
jgi:CRISPR-associated protein Csy2